MPRGDEWTIEKAPNGTFDLFHNRRPVAYDREDLDEAMWAAKRQGVTEVIVVEDDGYRRAVRL